MGAGQDRRGEEGSGRALLYSTLVLVGRSGMRATEPKLRWPGKGARAEGGERQRDRREWSEWNECRLCEWGDISHVLIFEPSQSK